MPAVRALRCLVTLAVALVVALAVVGCGGDSVPDPDLAEQPQAMSLEQREAGLPPGFPIEIPVLAGEVTVAETTGEPDLGPWHYVIRTDVETAAIVEWYKQAYAGRSWRLVSEAEETDGYAMIFTKGSGAWSTVHVVAAEDGTTVECWAGIGVPVPPEAVPTSVQGGLDV